MVNDPVILGDLDFKYVDLETALRESDILTIHLPLLPSTKHLINMDSIKKLKPGVVIVNTSRGGIINNQALLYGLENNIIKFAGLDVLDNEELLKTPESNSSELETIKKIIKMKNVCVTPHNGFNTEEAVKRRMDVVVENLTAFYSGTPINIVKPFV